MIKTERPVTEGTGCFRIWGGGAQGQMQEDRLKGFVENIRPIPSDSPLISRNYPTNKPKKRCLLWLDCSRRALNLEAGEAKSSSELLYNKNKKIK